MHKEAHAEAAAAASLRRAAADPANPATSSVSRLDGAELALLQAAAAHSKAAYGALAASGHVSTAASYLSLVTLGQATRHAPRHILPAAHLRGVHQLTGCPPADVLAAQWIAHLHRPAFYVALDRQRRSVVVSIRGTLQLGDYATVLDAVPQPVSVCGISGHVHGGFLAAARNLLPPVCAALQAAAIACPGWPVLVTGHSLGGGVAAVLTMLLVEQRQQWEAQADEEGQQGEEQQQQQQQQQQQLMWRQLGVLRCVGVGAAAAFCKTLGTAAKPHVTSVLYGADCLPMFSVLGARLLIEEVHAKSWAAAAIGSLLQRSTRFSWRRSGASAGIGSSNSIKAGVLPALMRSTSAASSAGSSLSCELVCGAGGCRGLCTCVADSASEMTEIEDASHRPISSSTAPAVAGTCSIGGARRLQRCSSACSSASTASIAAFAAEACADRGAALVPMFPPGRILWLLPPGQGEQKGACGNAGLQAEAAAGLQMVETDQSAFERFLFTLETAHVHLPDNYIQAINAVAA